ncbi:hypothetical protein Bca101_012924 [Brassica carinata]
MFLDSKEKQDQLIVSKMIQILAKVEEERIQVAAAAQQATINELTLVQKFAWITTESPLSLGQTLSSSNGVYELGFFSPNNSQNQYVGIWYKGILPRVVVWVANREKPVTDSTANLAINSNGTLLLFNGKHGVVWSIGETSASNGSRAELLDTGNLIVMENVSGRTIWESFAHLSDTMLPLSSMMYNLSTGEKRVLTSWKSYNDPSPGDFVLQITPQVPSQVYTMRGSSRYWRSGPWTKTRYAGIPAMDVTYASPFSSQQDANGSGSFTYIETRLRSCIILTSEGSVRIYWHTGSDWILKYDALLSPCDIYGVCGPFGLCIPPKCKCLKGFVPKYIEEWQRGNWTGGCVRRTELHCQGSSSGKDVNVFHSIANTKPPDNYELASSATPILLTEECHQICLHNCSCLAFSFINGIGCLVWSQELIDVVKFPAGGELLSIRLARSELGTAYKITGKRYYVKYSSIGSGGKYRKSIAAASVASLFLFIVLGSAAFGFWRYRVNHTNSRKRLEIDWLKRFNIIQGIARGILYLHRDSRLKVIHRDLKVSNILLDEKMNPKISDFGLARMYQGTEYQENTRRVVGTLGYMAPEYAWSGMFSEKSDIYSFGVLLLEIISGEKISRFSYGEEGKTLIAYAWESWCETGGIDLLDKDVADSCQPLEVERCVQIGLLCVQHQPSERPNTLELLSMLTTTSDLPSPKEPTFVVHAREEKSLSKGLITDNEISQTVILGR